MPDREKLLGKLRDYPGLFVAFSGGVDSAVLLRAALEALGPDRVACATFRSALLSGRDLSDAALLAEKWGVSHVFLDVDEFSVPEVLHNDVRRCYFCKRLAFETLLAYQREHYPGWVLADGTNADDLHQYRPGLQALRELEVASPLALCGLQKDQVRALARELGVEVSEKPSSPCLATRLPYGTTLTRELLRRIELAEEVVRKAGVSTVRVRVHGEIARIETEPQAFSKLLGNHRLVTELHQLGFTYITLDLDGFRSGSMDRFPGRSESSKAGV